MTNNKKSCLLEQGPSVIYHFLRRFDLLTNPAHHLGVDLVMLTADVFTTDTLSTEVLVSQLVVGQDEFIFVLQAALVMLQSRRFLI